MIEEFNKLQQKGAVEEYEEKFEELKTLMLLRNQKLDELYFVSSFISGLKEEIRPSVNMFKPQTLSKAFEVAELQECSLEVQAKHSRNAGKMVLESRFGLSKNISRGLPAPTVFQPLLPTITSRKTWPGSLIRSRLKKSNIGANTVYAIGVVKNLARGTDVGQGT